MDLVRDNVWQTCVTPNWIQAVKAILIERKTQHCCTVKLLPLFFSRDELSTGNTNGSHKMLLISWNPNKIQQLPSNNVIVKFGCQGGNAVFLAQRNFPPLTSSWNLLYSKYDFLWCLQHSKWALHKDLKCKKWKIRQTFDGVQFATWLSSVKCKLEQCLCACSQ